MERGDGSHSQEQQECLWPRPVGEELACKEISKLLSLMYRWERGMRIQVNLEVKAVDRVIYRDP